MKQLTEDVYQLKGWPKNAINVYLIGDVLIDAATRQAEKRITRQIAGKTVSAHALTHVHPDHQGSSHALARARPGADRRRRAHEREPEHWCRRTARTARVRHARSSPQPRLRAATG